MTDKPEEKAGQEGGCCESSGGGCCESSGGGCGSGSGGCRRRCCAGKAAFAIVLLLVGGLIGFWLGRCGSGSCKMGGSMPPCPMGAMSAPAK